MLSLSIENNGCWKSNLRESGRCKNYSSHDVTYISLYGTQLVTVEPLKLAYPIRDEAERTRDL